MLSKKPLISRILQKRGLGECVFGDLGGMVDALPPAQKVEQPIGIGAQGEFVDAPQTLAIEEAIGPFHFAAGGLLDDAEGGGLETWVDKGRETFSLGGLQQSLELAGVPRGRTET